MFNWDTAPTFAVMLLFCLLAAYVLTRNPRSPASLAAVAAQVAAAAFLLGQGMAANAQTLAEWRAWSRSLIWGATLAPVLWYWLTVLLLREEHECSTARWLRRGAFPLGLAFAALSALLTVGVYAGDFIFRWSAPTPLPLERVVYAQYHLEDGPLHGLFVLFILGTTAGAVLNVGLGWLRVREPARHRRFALLFLSAVLFLVAANLLGIAASLNWTGDQEIALGHLLLGVAMLVMVWNVAAYDLLLRGRRMWRDALYFLTLLGAVVVLYVMVFAAAGGPTYSFQQLQLFVILMVLVVVSHAFVDVGRLALDPLFFGRDVQSLRSNLVSVVQDAALAPDLAPVLAEAQREIAAASSEHFARMTEEALRRLNNPAALADCRLTTAMPRTLRAAAQRLQATESAEPTPLQQAQALRETLSRTIERLKPADAGGSSPAALQYQILYEEYLQGLPNKQIMLRHNISESTFHRNRRDAITVLARELQRQEDLLPLA